METLTIGQLAKNLSRINKQSTSVTDLPARYMHLGERKDKQRHSS